MKQVTSVPRNEGEKTNKKNPKNTVRAMPTCFPAHLRVTGPHFHWNSTWPKSATDDMKRRRRLESLPRRCGKKIKEKRLTVPTLKRCTNSAGFPPKTILLHPLNKKKKSNRSNGSRNWGHRHGRWGPAFPLPLSVINDSLFKSVDKKKWSSSKSRLT